MCYINNYNNNINLVLSDQCIPIYPVFIYMHYIFIMSKLLLIYPIINPVNLESSMVGHLTPANLFRIFIDRLLCPT